MIYNTVAFTGHRTQYFDSRHNEKVEIIKWVKNALYLISKRAIDVHGVKHFVSGGALGVDCWGAEVVLWLRDKENRNITLEIAKPFPSYDSKWTDGDRARYNKICDRANEVNILQPEPFAHWKYQHRNVYMVKKADIMIAVFGRTTGKSGTGNCIGSAKYFKIPIILINPTKKEITLWKPSQ